MSPVNADGRPVESGGARWSPVESGRVQWSPLDLLILFESVGVSLESDRTSPTGLQKSPTELILMKYSIFDESDGVRSGPVAVWSDFFSCFNGNLRLHRSPIGPG